MGMNKIAIYWWHLRDWASWVLGGFVVLGIGSWVVNFVLDFVGTGAILTNIVYIILLGGSVLLPVQRVRATWPPTERQAKKFKRNFKGSRNKSNKDDDWRDPSDLPDDDGILDK